MTNKGIPAYTGAFLFLFFPYHAATSGRINGVQLFSNVIHFTGFGSQPDPPSVSSSLSPPLSPSPSLSLEFVLHFVILRACHPYPMPEVQHQSHPHSGVEFSEFGGTWDPLLCHGEKRVSKKAKRLMQQNNNFNVLISNLLCFSLLFKAQRWICLIQEVSLLRQGVFVFFARGWHSTPVLGSWNACCWPLAELCHQATSCIGNRGTTPGSYACLLFEAAEK